MIFSFKKFQIYTLKRLIYAITSFLNNLKIKLVLIFTICFRKNALNYYLSSHLKGEL